jgi:putative PIN family toxin of toxin-antitoxin system
VSRRVVFDTSTLVSAALRIGSIPHRALAESFRSWDVCASTETLLDLERVLTRGKFERYLPRAQRGDFVTLLRRNVHLFAVEEDQLRGVKPHCRDLLDDKFLALALAAEADVLVSSDEDLLVRHPWRGIRIVRPAEFLSHSASGAPK